MITLCSELSVSLGWALPVLFNTGRKSVLYPWPMEKAHTYISFQSSLFSQRALIKGPTQSQSWSCCRKTKAGPLHNHASCAPLRVDGTLSNIGAFPFLLIIGL